MLPVCCQGTLRRWVGHLTLWALPSHPRPGLWDEEAAWAQSATLAPDRPTLAPAQLTSFFGALESVLRYRATVVQAFKDMNRFTVNETVLSTKDVLILLHKWSLIERDARLQDDLRAAIEKYQVKELLSECQDPTVWRSPDCAQLPTEHPAVCLSEQHFRSCQGLGTGHTRPRSPAEVAGEAWL